MSQPPPQVRARMYGCFKPLRRASASDADAATTVYLFTVQSPKDSGPRRRQDALLLRLSRSGRSAAQNCVAALPNVLWQQSLDASPDVCLSVSLHRRRSLPAPSALHLLERTAPCGQVTRCTGMASSTRGALLAILTQDGVCCSTPPLRVLIRRDWKQPVIRSKALQTGSHDFLAIGLIQRHALIAPGFAALPAARPTKKQGHIPLVADDISSSQL